MSIFLVLQLGCILCTPKRQRSKVLKIKWHPGVLFIQRMWLVTVRVSIFKLKNTSCFVKVSRGANYVGVNLTDDGGPIIFVLKKNKPIMSCYFNFQPIIFLPHPHMGTHKLSYILFFWTYQRHNTSGAKVWLCSCTGSVLTISCSNSSLSFFVNDTSDDTPVELWLKKIIDHLLVTSLT